MGFVKKTFLCLVFSVMALSAGSAAADGGKLGFVLSGGGARGFAHIGALKALEELGIKPDIVVGTSMGAMVGGAYCGGYTPEEIEKITLGVDWARMFAPRPDRKDISWQAKENDRAGFAKGEIGIGSNGLVIPRQMIPPHELDNFIAGVCAKVPQVRDLGNFSVQFAAMATDLETGAKVVLQKDVTLAQAMRASMSLPAAFEPVTLNGRILVDGGLVANMPVEQARSMGADRVIAINIGRPLADRSTLTSFIGVMGQMVDILTDLNVQASEKTLTGEDAYIKPDLEAFGAGDFVKASEIIAAGYEAVMKQKDDLLRFASKSGEFARAMQAKADQLARDEKHEISKVVVQGSGGVNPEYVRNSIDIAEGDVVDSERLAENARHLWGSGYFKNVTYRMEPGPGGTSIAVFEPQKKEQGFSTLRFGGNLQTDFEDTNEFNVILGHSFEWLNDWGASWRNEIGLGQTGRLTSVFEQPLGAGSDWFLQAKAEHVRKNYDVYYGSSDPVLSMTEERNIMQASLGYGFGRIGRVMLDVGHAWEDLKTDVSLVPARWRSRYDYANLGLTIDTLDSSDFPTRGLYVDIDAGQVLGRSAGSGNNFIYEADVRIPVSLGGEWNAVLSGKFGRSGISRHFEMGGVFRLSGSPYGRYRGDSLVFGNLAVMRRLGNTGMLWNLPAYVGASLEAGRVWNSGEGFDSPDNSAKYAASAFFGAETALGPVYLVLGRTFGESASLTLYWGSMFGD